MKKTIHVEEYRNLLNWLREKREKKGISMRDMGNRLGVHHSWVGRIETGERRLDIVEFMRFCKVLAADPLDGLKLVSHPSGHCRPKQAAESKVSCGSSK